MTILIVTNIPSVINLIIRIYRSVISFSLMWSSRDSSCCAILTAFPLNFLTNIRVTDYMLGHGIVRGSHRRVTKVYKKKKTCVTFVHCWISLSLSLSLSLSSFPVFPFRKKKKWGKKNNATAPRTIPVLHFNTLIWIRTKKLTDFGVNNK